MSFPISVHKHPAWVFIFFLFSLFAFPLCLSDPRISVSGLHCGSSKVTAKNTSFIPSFVKDMETLSQLITSHHWATHSVNATSTASIYGLAQCFQDLSQTDCLLCYAESRTKLPRCLPSISARIFLDGCFLRYDNYSFYSEATDPLTDTVNCSSSYGMIADETERARFVKNVGYAVENVTSSAIENGGFGVGEVGGVYVLAQCWNTVSSDGCKTCLEKASRSVKECVPRKEGRALNAGCYLRYSTVKFYNEGGGAAHKKGLSGRELAVTIVFAAAALLMLSLSAAFAGYTKLSKLRRVRNNQGQVSTSMSLSGLNFKYETLEKATDYFNPSRKLGEGGAGSVFKGTLPNGTTVAVKRLIFNTTQWVDQFFNEVNLISGIQHKNLVKLLGCSIEGPESLLVYEYVPNRSLDQFIFDKSRVQVLNWKQRFHIIVGTAEGLAYLHEGCETRIVHRDIKSSNVLLDEDLNPKIADFGLARCFAADETHLSTGIAGTLGYMAPEYLVQGQLTEKADVYSFGVLVLEIVCGRRNHAFNEDCASLLQKVWDLYRSNRVVEAIDPCLGHDFPAKEASDVIQIGLLCTQASVASRPPMVQVVGMLKDAECEIPVPGQPPFLQSAKLEPAGSSCSYSLNTLVTNTVKKLQASDSSTPASSTESSSRPSKSGDLMLSWNC